MEDRRKLIAEIREGLAKLQPLMDLARIKEGYYVIPDQMQLDQIREESLQEASSWIQRTLETIYADWRQIRKQQSEERWRWALELDPESYQSHREVIIHNAAVRKARKWLYTKFRPELFKAGQHKKIMGKATS